MTEAPPALRPAAPGDEAFLFDVYASTRQEELALVDWDQGQKDAFLQMQFAAQDRHYREHYASASFDVVLVDGRPVGRLYVARSASEIRVVDIALLPEHRRLGIGRALIEALLAEANEAGKPVTIHVEQFNPAQSLYLRLGFRPVADIGVYLLMAWAPAQETTAS